MFYLSAYFVIYILLLFHPWPQEDPLTLETQVSLADRLFPVVRVFHYYFVKTFWEKVP